MSECFWLFLAETDRLHLTFRHAEQLHHVHNTLGSPLAEGDVVLAAASLIAVALDRDSGSRVVAQIAAMRLDQGPEYRLYVGLVEVVIDAAFRQDVVRVVQDVRGTGGWVAGRVCGGAATAFGALDGVRAGAGWMDSWGVLAHPASSASSTSSTSVGSTDLPAGVIMRLSLPSLYGRSSSGGKILFMKIYLCNINYLSLSVNRMACAVVNNVSSREVIDAGIALPVVLAPAGGALLGGYLSSTYVS